MSNGIGKRQNEEDSIAMLAAQRELYNEAGRIDNINFVLSVVLPLLFSVLQYFGFWKNWVTYLSYTLTIIMLILSLLFARASKSKKALASSIQLEFDLYVYQMPWDKKLFGKRKNLNADIAIYSKKLLSKNGERERLIDWYTPNVDSAPIMDGILSCQKENCSWDVGLRKRYRAFSIVTIAILILAIFLMGLFRGETVLQLVLRIIFIAPMLRWLFPLVNGLNDDIDRLKELDNSLHNSDTKTMDDLQIIQKDITDPRRSAVKIPNRIYSIFKDNDEDREHRIAEMDLKGKAT